MKKDVLIFQNYRETQLIMLPKSLKNLLFSHEGKADSAR